MTATAPSGPIYQQFDAVKPPQRFLSIAEAYIDDIQVTIPEKSRRAILREADLSHGLFNALKTHPERIPDLSSIKGVVDAINKYLAVAQKWPIEHALVAAGHPIESARKLPALAPGNAWRRPDTNDQMPRGRASVATNMFAFDVLQTSGLERSVMNRRNFNVSTDMGIIIGRVPGYPLQRSPDEWVIFLHPQADRSVPDDAYALVRVGPQEVRAFPRQGYTKSQVIGWLIGVMYIPGALKEPVDDAGSVAASSLTSGR